MTFFFKVFNGNPIIKSLNYFCLKKKIKKGYIINFSIGQLVWLQIVHNSSLDNIKLAFSRLTILLQNRKAVHLIIFENSFKISLCLRKLLSKAIFCALPSSDFFLCFCHCKMPRWVRVFFFLRAKMGALKLLAKTIYPKKEKKSSRKKSKHHSLYFHNT